MASVRKYFQILHQAWGAQHWWPAESALEVIVGAILTQNTAWTNVERALQNLRTAGILTYPGLKAASVSELEQLVRPSGYYRQKALRLKNFIHWVEAEHGGSLRRMLSQPTAKLRVQLLAQNGIGPETADSILLYAGQHEVFVVDAYTRRIFERHGLITPKTTYEEIRALVERELSAPPLRAECGEPPVREGVPAVHLPSPMSGADRSPLAQCYNEFHGLIVQVGKHFCLKSIPRCEECPLRELLPRAERISARGSV